MKRIAILTILVFFSIISIGQIKSQKIKAKDSYIHNSTNIRFPLQIENFNRIEINAFDKKKTNIGVTYKNSDLKGETLFTVYLYPAGKANDNRLRNEYINSMQSVANFSKNGINAIQYSVFYKNSGYKINGFKAEINSFDSKSSLSIFECGKWFFKVRITSENLDSLQIINLENKVLEFFNPTKLVKDSPLNPKADISFARTAFSDSTLLGSAMGSAFKKLSWALENVDSLERASGFPGMYLELHIESLKEFVEFEKKHPKISKTKNTENYLNELNKIIESGFLAEFIMEQYGMIMIVPENRTFDYSGFEMWKKENPITIDLIQRFYEIWFRD